MLLLFRTAEVAARESVTVQVRKYAAGSRPGAHRPVHVPAFVRFVDSWRFNRRSPARR